MASRDCFFLWTSYSDNSMFMGMNVRAGYLAKASAFARALRRTSRRDTRASNMPFHETNPFYFRGFIAVASSFTASYAVCSGVCKWVRSGKTNPFRGRFGGCFAPFARNEPTLERCSNFDGERATRPTNRNLADSESLRQQGDGVGVGQVGGEGFAAVGLPVEGAKAGAGEGAFGLARQLDDYIRCQSFILEDLFRGSHVVGGGRHQDGTVSQGGGRDEVPAAKALCADDPGAFVVLQRRGKDLRLGPGAAVDEQDQRRGDLEVFVTDERGVQPRDSVLQRGDFGAFHQEEGRGHLRGLKRAAGIVAQVENNAGRALALGEDHGRTEIFDSVLGELGDAKVGDALVEVTQDGLRGGTRYGAAQVQVANGAGARIKNAQVHGKIPRTTQQTVDFDAPCVGRGDVADGDDLFAAEQAAVFRRAAIAWRDNRREIITDGEAETDSGSGIGQLVRDRGLPGRKQIRFGIDGADKSAQRGLGAAGGVDARGLDIAFLQHLQQFRETRQCLEGGRRGGEKPRFVGGVGGGRQEERA